MIPSVVLVGLGLGELSAPCVKTRVLSFTVTNNNMSVTIAYQSEMSGQRSCIIPIDFELPERVDSICHSMLFPRLCKFECSTSATTGLAYAISGSAWFVFLLCMTCILYAPTGQENAGRAENQILPIAAALNASRANRTTGTVQPVNDIELARVSVEDADKVQIGKGDSGNAHVVVINPS